MDFPDNWKKNRCCTTSDKREGEGLSVKVSHSLVAAGAVVDRSLLYLGTAKRRTYADRNN